MSVISIGRGKPPKPTSVKAAQGTLKPSRANTREPVSPLVQVPPPPEHLTPFEVEIWTRLAKTIDALKIYTEADFDSLCLLAGAIAVAERSRRAIFSHSTNCVKEVTELACKMKPNPELATYKEYIKLAQVALSRFGLSPADRQRVSTIGDGEDPFSEFG